VTTSFVDRLGRERAIAIVRAPDQAQARLGMEAAVEGGFRICEFTLNTPGAFELVRAFAREPDLVVGAGTVLTVDDARAAVDKGARFLVSPVVDEAVIAEAVKLGVPCLPGCATPTELLKAWRAGAPVLKLFPAISPDWVRAVISPMPFLRLAPTNGDADNARAHLAAGAFAVGFVRSLFDPAELARGDRAAVRARAERLLAAVG
jgi:Entner-Doudoroff aldolase